MHYFSIFLFSASVNVDNFTVGVTCGMEKKKISFINNLIIAIITVFTTFLSMVIGKTICNFLDWHIANLIGGSILICLGFFISEGIYQDKNSVDNKIFNWNYCKKIVENPSLVSEKVPKKITIRDSIYLGFMLSLNNIAIGMVGGMTEINLVITCLLTFICSIAAIIIGRCYGKKHLTNTFAKAAPIVSGLTVIVLGFYEVLIIILSK